MGRLENTPVITAATAGFLIGIMGLVNSKGLREISFRILAGLVLFYVLGILLKNVLSDAFEQIEKRKEEERKKEEELLNEEKMKALQVPVENREKGKNINIAVGEEEEFLPLQLEEMKINKT